METQGWQLRLSSSTPLAGCPHSHTMRRAHCSIMLCAAMTPFANALEEDHSYRGSAPATASIWPLGRAGDEPGRNTSPKHGRSMMDWLCIVLQMLACKRSEWCLSQKHVGRERQPEDERGKAHMVVRATTAVPASVLVRQTGQRHGDLCFLCSCELYCYLLKASVTTGASSTRACTGSFLSRGS